MAGEIDPTKSISEIAETIRKALQPFLDPVLGEAGAYLAQRIQFLRYRNAVHLAERAAEIARERGYNPHPVKLKFLASVVEGAALEEEDPLLERWAGLLAAASGGLDLPASYPTVLSQIGSSEVALLDRLYGGNEFKVDAGTVRGEMGIRIVDFERLVMSIRRLGLVHIGITVNDMDLDPPRIRDHNELRLSTLGRHFVGSCRGEQVKFMQLS